MYEDEMPSNAELMRHDGFLWSVKDAAEAKALVATGRPVIDLVNDGRYHGTVSVGADHVECGRIAARHLISRRIRNFAFFGWRGLRFSDARHRAFSDQLAQCGFACESYLSRQEGMGRFLSRNVMRERLSLPRDAKSVARWVASLKKPVGVFCANDLRAWQLVETCRREGLSVPAEVAVLGADNDTVPCLISSVPISSVDTNIFETGRKAAELLDRLMNSADVTDAVPTLVRPAGVVPRESTAIYPVSPPWLSHALGYIYEHTDRSLTAADVVKETGLSYSTVENAFRSVLGTSIQKEIMSARLERAEHLLHSTDLSMAEVARRSGYKTPQYFSLAFSAKHGAPPSSWRQRR